MKPGEKVITSGGDQIFPRGLPVGVVDQIVPDTSNPPYMDILIKPAANLGHLEELLVITQSGEQMPKTAQQDLAQSAAEGLAVSQQRASDVLAERLPGLNNPNALADQPHGTPLLAGNPDAPGAPKLHPPPTLHEDHFSPAATQPARALTPGQAIVDPKYAVTAESMAPVEAPAKADGVKAADGKVTAGATKPGAVVKAKPKVVKPEAVIAPDAAPASDGGTPPQ